MKSVNQKLFLINLVILLGAMIAARTIVDFDLYSAPQSAQAAAFKENFLKAFAVLLALTVLLQVYLHRTITRPLRNLLRAIKSRIASASFDPVAVSGSDEIARLGVSFNALQKSLQTQIQWLDQFANNVCHEIRGPLTTIVAATELMEKQQRFDGSILAMIREEALRLSEFSTAILATSQSPRQPLQRTRETLSELVSEVSLALGATGNITVTAPHPEQTIMVDKRLFRILIENLLRNGLRFADPGTNVEVNIARIFRAHPDDSSLILTVTNRGPFIPEPYLERIFERFLSVAISGKPKGHGIGLALCRDIVSMHGGTIHAENLAIGGVAFVTELPWVSEGD